MFDQTCNNAVRELILDHRTIPWYDLDSVTSTMDIARDLAGQGHHSWTAVTAHRQTSGRGTHGRDWVSPHDEGLWLSLIIPPPDHNKMESLSLMTARVLVTVLDSLFAITGTVKEPNDVLVGGRKIAGILLESESTGGKFDCLILGMGLNLAQDRVFFDEAGLSDATSVFCETGIVPDRDKTLRAFVSTFIDTYFSGAW